MAPNSPKVGTYLLIVPAAGAVAQLGERRNRTAEVRGSNPLGSTSLRSLREAAARQVAPDDLERNGPKAAAYRAVCKCPSNHDTGRRRLATASYSRPNTLISSPAPR